MGLSGSGINEENRIVSGSWIAWLTDDSIGTILSVPFCPYHFVPYHFVLEPLKESYDIVKGTNTAVIGVVGFDDASSSHTDSVIIFFFCRIIFALGFWPGCANCVIRQRSGSCGRRGDSLTDWLSSGWKVKVLGTRGGRRQMIQFSCKTIVQFTVQW